MIQHEPLGNGLDQELTKEYYIEDNIKPFREEEGVVMKTFSCLFINESRCSQLQTSKDNDDQDDVLEDLVMLVAEEEEEAAHRVRVGEDEEGFLASEITVKEVRFLLVMILRLLRQQALQLFIPFTSGPIHPHRCAPSYTQLTPSESCIAVHGM